MSNGAKQATLDTDAMHTDPVLIAHAFVAAINRHNADEIANLMSEDHVFIDSDGSATRGKQCMRGGWEQYLQMFPDYTITVEETYSQGRNVVMLGVAQGTFAVEGRLLAKNRWSVPAAWRAKVDGEKVLGWRVYVNVEPILEVMTKASA